MGNVHGISVSEYDLGFEAGKRQTQKDSLMILGAVISVAGGEIRIPENVLLSVEPGRVVREDDPVTREVVLKVIE